MALARRGAVTCGPGQSAALNGIRVVALQRDLLNRHFAGSYPRGRPSIPTYRFGSSCLLLLGRLLSAEFRAGVDQGLPGSRNRFDQGRPYIG